MESRDFIDLTRKILDSEPGVRERAADEVTDLVNAYSPVQATTLAVLLSAAAACEEMNSVLEAELHAILELTSTGYVNAGHVAQLREIRLDEVPVELREYVIDLLEG
ncbi:MULTISPECIES: hypothetical protein [unclassified Streptomyces]|uniref:hypothetical protein n=1 Tax=unclassified Streptomyces TaxID=2593676 RepID=UPI0024746443|nr:MULTISPECIES: hypothetical protein [unclassified Streptomyces]MDH6452466.1 small ligand-binding sensory domain FIST [Streptomyces sp. SAI-119]MDH6496978.1 small ligand-binding sensory domain FIST [Streptomyces sp. SAI-149]